MNDLAWKWVAALRSGKYKQTTGRLRDGDSFCCLGVACDIFDSGSWVGNFYSGRESTLPLDVCKAYDIPFEVERKLIELNDMGVTFYRIAAVIEELGA